MGGDAERGIAHVYYGVLGVLGLLVEYLHIL